MASNVSLTNVSTRSPSGCLTRCWNASAKIGSAHAPEADAAVRLHHLVDLVERVRVHLDHVVEEPDGEPDHPVHLLPVDRPLTALAPAGELRHVERAEIARLVRQERLLTA